MPWPPSVDELSSVQARWPDLGVDPDAFARDLLDRPEGARPPTAHLGDLYLAWACAQGSVRALDVFAEKFGASIALAVRRYPVAHDEVVQQIRVRLFVSEDGAPARITRYSGVGPLGAWVRTFATRVAIDEVRRLRSSESLHSNLPVERTEPARALDRAHHAPTVRAVIEACLAELPRQERLVFKLHVIDGVSLDKISTMTARHRSSVHRTVERVRAHLADEVPRQLALRLVAQPDEVAELVADVWSQLSISVARVLDGQ